MSYPPQGAGAGITKLSELTIDVSKDWNAKKIENLAAPDSADDASRRAVRTATLVVAANDSTAKGKEQADYVCNGVDDNVEIQAALDALPATGGEVKLLDGTFNITATINLDTNQTLKGCGRNTILTTLTADLVFLSAVGGAGTEKTGIIIANMQIDGGAGGVSDIGIYFEYVDYSFIQNVYSRRHASGTGTSLSGICLLNSDFNQIVSNTCQGNGYDGITLYTSSNNTITGNTCQGNSADGIILLLSSNNTITGNTCQGNNNDGIILDTSSNNTITGNTCQGNNNDGIILLLSSNNTITGNTCQGNSADGISLQNSSNNNTITGNTCQGNNDGITLYYSSNNTITGNTCQGNSADGIYLQDSSNNNTITGNTCQSNSQGTDNTNNGIWLSDSDYNLISGNLCRAPIIGTTLTIGEVIGVTDIRVTDETGFEVGLGVVIDLGGGNEEYHYIIAIAAGIITIDTPLLNNQGAGETIDVPRAKYGINISNDACDRNCLIGNDLYNSGKTGDLNDVPTTNPTLKHDNRDLAGTGWLPEV